MEKEGKREIKRGKENISKKGEIKEKMLYIFYKIRKKALKMDQFCLEFSKKSRLPNPSEPRPYKKGGRKKSIQNSGWGKKSMSRYYIHISPPCSRHLHVSAGVGLLFVCTGRRAQSEIQELKQIKILF